MFDNLSSRLSQTMRNISGRGRLTEENIKETIREVRIALLEADVALPVVRNFINRVKERAIGYDINKSFTPGQELIKIVRHELISVMTSKANTLNFNVQPPVIILIVGLQGAGKTTTVAKLSKFLYNKSKKKILAVSTDIYRPAAIEQLKILIKKVGVDFFQSEMNLKPVEIVRNALKEAKLKFYDILLIDTAGRLHIDEIMMEEIKQIYYAINPTETLFVIDAMIGQDAANIAKSFDTLLPLTGIILTKVDGDARGGSALSICHITGKPIKFIGVGEKNDSLEVFYPDRIASRILGMGDMLSLIEDIEYKVDREQAEKLVKKIKKGVDFDLNDFLVQLKQLYKIGGISNLIDKLPGYDHLTNNLKLDINNKTLISMEAIINSMTFKERKNPEIIKGSRKRRIAMGAGLQVQDVNRLLKQFEDMQKMIKKIKSGNIKKMLRRVKNIPNLF